MLRMRRYRVFLLVATLSAASLYYLVHVRHATLYDVDRLRHISFGHTSQNDRPTEERLKPPPPEYQPDPPLAVAHPPPEPEHELPPVPSTTLKKISHPEPTWTAADGVETVTGEELLPKKPQKDSHLKEINESQYEATRGAEQIPQAHWQPQKEHNPVPDNELIRLPGGSPKGLPQVQYNFPPETNAEKKDRLQKLVAVREAFKHAWQGYDSFALPHDELWAVSKTYGDSFMGWGATLIDSLDTLWIMDLKDEFEKAIQEVEKIDFKTSHKKEIPMFETVIRILGGLVAAHDLSNGQYPVLLEKATELADIMMGAFDTPNRMPDLFYRWAPSYASQQHRSSSRVVMSQLGTMSVEFTRLAQLTKKDKYYDAIARVQNALEEWQMKTEIPGLWPLTMDASGCKKVDRVKIQSDTAENIEHPILIDSAQVSEEELFKDEKSAKQPPDAAKAAKQHSKRQADDNTAVSKPSIDKEPAGNDKAASEVAPEEATDNSEELQDPLCEPQGLNYEPYAKKHKFAIAAQADSTYEYMPKMYRLLGGQTAQYETMYRNAANAIREKILYRPMIEDEKRKILFPAAYEFDTSKKARSKRIQTVWEATHLGCFAGGMFGLAAKTFNIPTDMEIARQLTDGCIWAYESTPTKIMPEKFALTPCEDREKCPWEVSLWHAALDPNMKDRMDAVDTWNKDQKTLYQKTGINVAKISEKVTEPAGSSDKVYKPVDTPRGTDESVSAPQGQPHSLVRRDPPVDDGPKKAPAPLYEEGETPLEQFGFKPKVAMSHDRYVQTRIREERLPPSYTVIYDRSYILRPEAIESIFIMYRITGEEYWRQQGWKMFQAVHEATHTEIGNAELQDVTSILGEKQDKMESFWLGETLKYFYLLFCEPSVISLDDYVLNTEAHPFKVPKA